MSQPGFVLGIDFGGTKLAVATSRGDARLLYRQEIPTCANRGAEQALRRAIGAGQRLVEQTRQSSGGRLEGVGVATMGVTEEDRVLMAPNVPGWDRLAIPGAIRAGFSTEAVKVENDVKAAARAEVKWGALSGVDIGMYLNLGTGIAAALVAGGQVIRGAHGAAGEIAYNLRHLHEDMAPDRRRAPLEEFVGGRAIEERARSQIGASCSAGEVFQRAAFDPEARAFVEAILTEIAFHLTNLAVAMDPERIVVGGGLLRSKDVVLPRLAAQVRRFVPFPPEVVEAHFTLDAALMGAIALAMDARA